MEHSLLKTQETQLEYSSFLRPQICFPLLCVKIPKTTLQKIFRPSLNTILHTLHLNNKKSLFPSPWRNQIIWPSDRWCLISARNITTPVPPWPSQKKDRTGQLIRIAHDDLEFSLGLGHSPLLHPTEVNKSYTPENCIHSLCTFLTKCNSSIDIRDPRVVNPQRTNYHHIIILAKTGG